MDHNYENIPLKETFHDILRLENNYSFLNNDNQNDDDSYGGYGGGPN